MCHKLWKLSDSRQSYCKNCQAYFFWPTLYSIARVIGKDIIMFDSFTTWYSVLTTSAATVSDIQALNGRKYSHTQIMWMCNVPHSQSQLESEVRFRTPPAFNALDDNDRSYRNVATTFRTRKLHLQRYCEEKIMNRWLLRHNHGGYFYHSLYTIDWYFWRTARLVAWWCSG